MKLQKNVYVNGSWKDDFTLQDTKNTAVLFFGNDYDAFLALKEVYKNAKLVGSSSSGAINGDSLHEGSLCMVMEMEKTELKTITLNNINYNNSYEYGVTAMSSLMEKENLKGVLLFTEGLDVNGAKVAEGMASVNSQVKVAGGTAADNLEFVETFVYSEDKYAKSLVALGFYGDDIEFQLGSQSGVKALGIEKKVTKSENNVLHSLDGEPASEVYKNIFKHKKIEELKSSILECPLIISSDFKKEEGLVRTPILLDEENQTVTFTGEIPEGKSVRFMRADLESMIEASENVSVTSWDKVPVEVQKNDSVLHLLISCSGRKAVLKEDTEDEFYASNKLVKNDKSYQVGFYSYGEYNRVNEEKGVEFLNQTMTATCIYEK